MAAPVILWQATALYIAAGAAAGTLSGLFGIGGGVVIVPMLCAIFSWEAMPRQVATHLALGTSLASIMATSASSVAAHHRRRAVRWDAVRRTTPGIVLGVGAGTAIAARLPTDALRMVFAAFLAAVSLDMLRSRPIGDGRTPPGPWGMRAAGAGIGIFSSLLGIGGGTLSVPFLLWCGLPALNAVATSAAMGIPIALSGAAGYAVNGWGAEGLPAACLGFIHLPSLLCLSAASVATAPLGARMAHRLPVGALRRGLACLLLAVAARMAWSAASAWR